MSIMQMSATGGCLIAAIALFRAVFFRKLPKRTLVWLWLAAALALLIPLRLSAPWSIYGLLPAAPASTGTAAVATVGPAKASVWPVIRRVVSIALAACLAVAYGAGLTRFYRGRIVRESWAERWLCDHPTRRLLTIRESEKVRAPVSGGILWPVILLPADRTWDEETLRCVLAHELTHIRRLDGAVKLVCAAALCLHWFNPLMWLMAALVCRDVEFACDEAVLSGERCRADYARAMLAAESARCARPLLSSGFGGATVRRMRAVQRFRRKGAASWIVSALAGAALVAVFATSPVTAAVKPPETAPDGAETVAAAAETAPGSLAYAVNDGPCHGIVVSKGAYVYYTPVVMPDNDTGREVVLLQMTLVPVKNADPHTADAIYRVTVGGEHTEKSTKIAATP